jgi:hypothetical protein
MTLSPVANRAIGCVAGAGTAKRTKTAMSTAASLTETTSQRQRSTRGLAVYLAVGFTGAWTTWIVCGLMARHGTPGGALVPAVIAGSFAPFLASGLAVWGASGTRAAVRFYARGLNWRMGWPVFGVSVFAIPLLGVVVAAVAGAVTGKPLSFQMGWQDLPYAYEDPTGVAFASAATQGVCHEIEILRSRDAPDFSVGGTDRQGALSHPCARTGLRSSPAKYGCQKITSSRERTPRPKSASPCDVADANRWISRARTSAIAHRGLSELRPRNPCLRRERCGAALYPRQSVGTAAPAAFPVAGPGR